MQLSRLNPQGIQEFDLELQRMRDGKVIVAPLDLLHDESCVEVIDTKTNVSATVFDTRKELAAHLNPILTGTSLKNDMADTGLWAWLAAVFIDTVSPANAEGARNPRAGHRHIPSNDYRNYYRHLIRGAVRIHRLFEYNLEEAAIVLCQVPSKPGDFVEQLASRQERITNPAIIAAANRLYYDEKGNKPKSGMAPPWQKPGTLRRYITLLDQLDLTYDLYSMGVEEILAVLPDEFDKEAT